MDNPVYESCASPAKPRHYWGASAVQKIPEEKCLYKNQIVINDRRKLCRAGTGNKRERQQQEGSCALKLAGEGTKVDNLHRDGEELAPPTGLEPVTYGLTVRRSTD